MRAVVRVFGGYVIACFMGGLTTVLFVYTPDQVAAWLVPLSGEDSSDRLSVFGLLWLAAATQSFIFALPFACVAAVIGEWRKIREWTYYAATGIAVAMLGFTAQWLSESTGQDWSVVGSYPVVAFLTTGFVAGFVYWMVAGRRAGGEPTPPPAPKATAAEAVAGTRRASAPQEA